MMDVNCDMGEGVPDQEAMMPYLTSANIACGGHAGDEDTMRIDDRAGDAARSEDRGASKLFR